MSKKNVQHLTKALAVIHIYGTPVVDKAALEAAKKQKAKRSGSHPGEDEDYGMTEQHSAYVFSCGTRKFLNSLYFYFCSAYVLSLSSLFVSLS